MEIKHYVYISLGNDILKIGETNNIYRRDRELKHTTIICAFEIKNIYCKAKAKYIESQIQYDFESCLIENMLDHFNLTKIANVFCISKYWPKHVIQEFIYYVEQKLINIDYIKYCKISYNL